MPAGSARCDKRFAKPSLVPGHYGVGNLQDRFVRTVIPYQPDNLRMGKVMVKGKDILYFGAAEPIDRLIIITDNTEICFRAGQLL